MGVHIAQGSDHKCSLEAYIVAAYTMAGVWINIGMQIYKPLNPHEE